MRTINVEQGTKEWHETRRCKITGTKLDDVMGTAYVRLCLIAELIAEEATEQSKALVTSAEMERGKAEEIFAIKEFETRNGKVVDQLGVCVSDDFDWVALSPDGFIKDAEGKYTEAVEVKSPDSKTAILYRLANMIPVEESGLTKAKTPWLGVPADYKWQIVQYFLVNADLLKLYFLVYDARFIDQKEKLYIVEVERANELVQDAVKEAKEALERFRADWLKWREVVLPDQF